MNISNQLSIITFFSLPTPPFSFATAITFIFISIFSFVKKIHSLQSVIGGDFRNRTGNNQILPKPHHK